MDNVHDERYVVFVRFEPGHGTPLSDSSEHPLATCSSYAEARRLRQVLQPNMTGDCVIRFMGATGGGD